MKEKGFAPILIILFIAVLIGGYLIYSGKINLNRTQSTSNRSTQVSPSAAITNKTADNFPSELRGYPIYPGSRYIKKEIKTPSDYLDIYCSDGNKSMDCTGDTANYIFEVDISSDNEESFLAWYRDPKNLLGWQFYGGAQNISEYRKNNTAFEFIWGSPINGSTVDYSKTEFTIRLPIK